MIEIIGGGPLQQAFLDFQIPAVKSAALTDKHENEWLQVWELTEEDYKQFETAATEQGAWSNEKYGWWRYATSNLKNDVIEVQVANQPLKAYKYPRHYYHSEEFRIECLRDGSPFELPNYLDLLDFLEFYYGITKPENITYAVSSLAPLNDMTKAELISNFTKTDKVTIFK